jgi:hypothetical protein
MRRKFAVPTGCQRYGKLHSRPYRRLPAGLAGPSPEPLHSGRRSKAAGCHDGIVTCIRPAFEDAKFPKRVYVYNYRLFDRHDEPILSLAVLADDDPAWRPCSFSLSLLGCELVLTFPTAKLLDWAGREAELRASDNVFARVTLAHLATRATRGDPAKRYAAKKELLHLLYERNFDRQRIVDVFAIVDWMMYLPFELERKLWRDIAALEESRNMRYVTSVERLGHEKGLQEGRQQGLQEGARQAEIRMLLRQLEQRFGPVPEAVRSRIAEAGVEELETWLDRVVTAPSLDAVLDDAKAH